MNLRYIYSDHLGSILALTDGSGNVVAKQNFDAWGRNRNPDNWTYTNVPDNPTWLYRGYTGHEHLRQFALINMNGRIYDPIQGRMLSPDNYVAKLWGTQAYNRFSYANNNPLKYTDADGNNPVVVALLVAAAVSAASYTIHVATSPGGFGNWNWVDFAGSLITGGRSGHAYLWNRERIWSNGQHRTRIVKGRCTWLRGVYLWFNKW